MTVDTPKIFFSYARADADFVLKLANDLRSAGISLWIDQLDIPPGDRWDSAVENALKASSCLLVVLSPASVISQNVMDEVAFALGSNKKIVPVVHRHCDIPFRIQRLQYIDFTATYNEGFTKLLRTLNVEQPSQTTQATAQRARVGEATSTVARIEPGISTKRLIYPLIAGLLAGVIGISYWIYVSRSMDRNSLAAPKPRQPQCGTTVPRPDDNHFFILGWAPVQGASTYNVELDCFGCSGRDWYSLAGSPWRVATGMGLRSSIYSSKVHVELHQSGGLALRWRVWAVDHNGQQGKKSEWCQISFVGDSSR